jgi:hypothetical protein
MKVVVPIGVSGEMFTTIGAGGGIVNVMIPLGTKAGQKLEVRVEY